VTAPIDVVDLGVAGMFNRFQRRPDMTRLPAAFLATGLPQATGAWLLQPITGRRFAAIIAILGSLVFQHLKTCLQCTDHSLQSVKQGKYRLFALLIGGAYFFVRR
jgi:hypothetical protein